MHLLNVGTLFLGGFWRFRQTVWSLKHVNVELISVLEK